ncbi:MAG: 30S ribosomal protein S1 [Acidobacteria bacterium]|nr:30S ribosomal protein S1 [Acidobacteriota bacterium]|tara:strand:- start:539 stop:2368 length:1830 start_codon:yes stop_codon:yes gene_type:complete
MEDAEGMSGKTAVESGDAEQQAVPEAIIAFSDEETLDDATLLQLIDQSLQELVEGEVVKGRVLEVSRDEVVVDIGYKSEGIMRLAEFADKDGKVSIVPGDEVEVLLERCEDKEGNVVVSREKAEKMKVWGKIEEAYRSDELITGLVVDRVKGGLAVNIGVRAFLPGSQVDIRPMRNLESMVNEEILVKVIKLNKRRANVVVSRKVVLEAERAEEKKGTLKKLVAGSILKGVVKNITDYGAFVDLGGIDGLLHITDMSWGRISHPTEILEIGDEIDVAVLNFDPERERVSLGYKQRMPDPWVGVSEKYPAGARIPGKVVSLTNYGAFVELEAGVEGLVHISEMSWRKRIQHPSKVLDVGDEADVVILDVDEDSRRISLGMKQTEPNPWRLIADKYEEGNIITGRVRNLTDFGAFVEVGEGIDGLIHISDMSWTERVEHPSEVLEKGEEVEVAVLSVDAERQRLSLGLKQLGPNVWDDYAKEHEQGEEVEGKITKLTNFGAFLDLADGVEGLVHVSEISDRHIKDPADELEVGDTLKVKILNIDTETKKISLSAKELEASRDEVEPEAETPSEPLTQYQQDGKVSLGDVVDLSGLGELSGGGEEGPEGEEE